MATTLAQKIINLLREAGKIPPQHTGKIIFEASTNQGGVTESEISIKLKVN